MLKVLIVEDFPLDRLNLLEMLGNRDDFPEIEVAGCCENGCEALRIIPVVQPNIIISDIEMPLMGGFELAKEVRKSHPGIKIVFYTMYSQYQYVRKALYLGGYGYVLKPASLPELQESIHNVAAALQNEAQYASEYAALHNLLQQSRPILTEYFLKDLLFGLITDPRDIRERLHYFQVPLQDGHYVVSSCEIDDFDAVTRHWNMEQRQILSLKVAERLREFSGTHFYTQLIKVDDSRFAMLHSYSGQIGAKQAVECATALSRSLLDEFVDTDISLSAGISRAGDRIEDVHSLYEQARYILRYKYSMGKGKVLLYDDIPSNPTCPDIDLNKIQKDLRYLLHAGTENEISTYVGTLFDGIPIQTEVDVYKGLCFSIASCLQGTVSGSAGLQNGGQLMSWDQIYQFQTAWDLRQWMSDKLLNASRQVQCKEQKRNRLIIDRTREFVQANYQKNLTLEFIATSLFYSPNYLNHIFKKETGETIYEYILHVRMERAKEMLTDGSFKLYEIAQLLGYSHTAYFSKLFKRHTGLTPKDFRERPVP